MLSLGANNNLSGFNPQYVPPWYTDTNYALNSVMPTLIHDYANSRFYTSSEGAGRSPFTGVRASNAMQFTQGGILAWAPSQMCTRGQDLSVGWSMGSDGTVVLSGNNAPTGAPAYTMTWTTAVPGAGNAITAQPALVGSPMMLSVYLRYVNHKWARVYMYSTTSTNNGIVAYVDLETNTIGANSALGTGTSYIGGSVEDVGDGWVRVTVAGNPNAVNATDIGLVIATASGNGLGTRVGNGAAIEAACVILEPYDSLSPQAWRPEFNTTGAAWYGARFDYDPATVNSYNYGAELITDPTCDVPAAWTAGTGWSVSGGQLVASGASNTGIEQTSVNFDSNKEYLIEFDYNISAGTITVYRGQGSQLIVGSLSGVGRGSYRFTPNLNGTSKILFNASVTATTATIDNVTVKEAIKSCRSLGLLVESTRTNDIARGFRLRTTDLTGLETTLTTGPTYLGGWESVRITSNSASNWHGAYPGSVTPTASQVRSVSAIVAYVNAQFVQVYTSGNYPLDVNNTYVNVDMINGTITTTGSAASQAFIRKLAAGIYHVGFTFTCQAAPIGGTGAIVGLITNGTAIRQESHTTPNLAVDVLYYCNMAGSGYTSIIPTFGTAATRSTDVINTNTGAWLDTTKGTVYGRGYRLNGNAVSTFVNIGDSGGSSERNQFRINTTTASHIITVGGVVQSTSAASIASIPTGYVEGAYRYIAGAQMMCVNGVLSGTPGNIASLPATQNTIHIGQLNSAGEKFDGWIERLIYWPDVSASNAQLQTLTTL